MSQLLTCLDGLTSTPHILVLAATNTLDSLDPALRRSGRFDRAIELPLPDLASRRALISFYLRGRKCLSSLEASGAIDRLAEHTAGFSAADLKRLVEEAVLAAIRERIAEMRKETGAADSNDANVTEAHLVRAQNRLLQKLKRERKEVAHTRPMELDNVD